MKKDKTNLKIIVAVIVSVIISSGITAFAAIKISATEIGYNNTTVADQLDSLYQTMFSDNYSTTEKQVGKWIDGKPLYQKTITGSFPTHAPGGWTQTNLIPDIETIVNIVGWYGNNNEYRCTIPEVGIIDSATGRVEIQTINGRTLTAITLQYTKTTDQPITNE